MIKTDTSIGQFAGLTYTRHTNGFGAGAGERRAAKSDVVMISDECKKRLIMSNLKASLTATDAIKSRYSK